MWMGEYDITKKRNDKITTSSLASRNFTYSSSGKVSDSRERGGGCPLETLSYEKVAEVILSLPCVYTL